MKVIFTLLITVCLSAKLVAQPTVGMDFDRMDCNGNNQHLFAELEAGNVVILEYFMLNCGSCIVAGNKLEKMKTGLEMQFPGKIKSYSIAYLDSYQCADISNWVTSNNYTSVPMDKGATEVAYYGGMGMPTVVVLGGSDHAILGEPYISFQSNDTTSIKNDVYAFFGVSGTGELGADQIKITPNPANEKVIISSDDANLALVELLDAQGRSMEVQNTSSNPNFTELDVTAVPAGVYTIRLVNNQGIITKRIAIIH